MRNIEILIIGQGLAGSILAHQLISKGQRVMVADNHHEQSSSMVATGIINPVTGHRLNITEGFAHLYPAAKTYFLDLQNELHIELWRPTRQLRLIKNTGQLRYYQKRLEQPEYTNILDNHMPTGHPFSTAHCGVVEIGCTAVVNVVGLLYKMKSWLADRDSIMSGVVDYQEIKSANGYFSFQDVKAAKIIFCEGHRATINPWLSKLPFKLSKGEVLTVDPGASVSQMLNWGNWLVPGFHGVKLGSTYEWNELSVAPNPKTEAKLLASLEKYTGLTATTTLHSTGIRPTTLRRIPFVGPLSELKNAYCFNGFGSKGCLLIPHHAQQLCDNLLYQQPLPRELTQCL